jgi:hypothetical protein
METRSDLFHGLFLWHAGEGAPSVSRHERGPAKVPCPETGRPLVVGTIDTGSAAICPRCEIPGHGGFVSFVGDLRMAYACPACRELIWLEGV